MDVKAALFACHIWQHSNCVLHMLWVVLGDLSPTATMYVTFRGILLSEKCLLAVSSGSRWGGCLELVALR